MLLYLFTLAAIVALDVMLSADNAIALAVVVSRLPEVSEGGHNLRRIALRLGFVLAFIFRAAALTVFFVILHISYIVWIGAAYLLYLSFKGLSGDGDQQPIARDGSFVRAIVAVAVTDFLFSIDNASAVAAFSSNLWVNLVAVGLSMFLMCMATQRMVRLVERFPVLGGVAYVLILWVGIQLTLESVGIAFSQSMKLFGMVVIIVVGLVYERSPVVHRILEGPFARVGAFMGSIVRIIDSVVPRRRRA